MYAWVQQLLQERLREGGLARAAPIASRMWQMLSEGYLQFEQCRCTPLALHMPCTPFWKQIVSTMWQMLSEGYLQFEQCRCLTGTAHALHTIWRQIVSIMWQMPSQGHLQFEQCRFALLAQTQVVCQWQVWSVACM